MAPGDVIGQVARRLGKFAVEFLERRAHLGTADRVRVQVDGGEPLDYLGQQTGSMQPIDLGAEAELLEQVAHGWGERLHVVSRFFLRRFGSAVRAARLFGDVL